MDCAISIQLEVPGLGRKVGAMTRRHLNLSETNSPLTLLLLHGGAGVQVGKNS
jgi:hypothetical protein